MTIFLNRYFTRARRHFVLNGMMYICCTCRKFVSRSRTVCKVPQDAIAHKWWHSCEPLSPFHEFELSLCHFATPLTVRHVLQARQRSTSAFPKLTPFWPGRQSPTTCSSAAGRVCWAACTSKCAPAFAHGLNPPQHCRPERLGLASLSVVTASIAEAGKAKLGAGSLPLIRP